MNFLEVIIDGNVNSTDEAVTLRIRQLIIPRRCPFNLLVIWTYRPIERIAPFMLYWVILKHFYIYLFLVYFYFEILFGIKYLGKIDVNVY